MRHAADVVRVQMRDDDFAESLALLHETSDHVVEQFLLILVWRTGIDHDHLVAADNVTIGVCRRRNGRRTQGAKVNAISKLHAAFQMIALFLWPAAHPLGEIPNA